jgi:hypothetical protein
LNFEVIYVFCAVRGQYSPHASPFSPHADPDSTWLQVWMILCMPAQSIYKLNFANLEKSSSKAEQKGQDGGSSQPRKNNRKKTARMEGKKDKT